MTADYGGNEDNIPNIALPDPCIVVHGQRPTRGQERDGIGDLCVALRHRWIPNELFVIFTAYFDETDTHGKAPDLILASALGHAFQWRRFDKKLSKLQKKYDFNIFHSKDFRPRNEKDFQLIEDLTKVLSSTTTEGFVISLKHDHYLQAYKTKLPRKMHPDSQYGLCFRGCLAHLTDFIADRGFADQLNIVMEQGHKNVEDCRRIFHEVERVYLDAGVNIFGMACTRFG